jgi:hypothetical protein
MSGKLSHGGDLEWAVWQAGERTISVPSKREAEEEARAPLPEDYTFVGRRATEPA